ncbi:hypothetical protein BDW74DRAFT_146274 [Aspergillus multicolor]|uniref:uncharacterized protein n=1 Tax=Aspergillus multicolor TaxID=41759 RepID=UPI003CCD5A48
MLSNPALSIVRLAVSMFAVSDFLAEFPPGQVSHKHNAKQTMYKWPIEFLGMALQGCCSSDAGMVRLAMSRPRRDLDRGWT